MDDLQEWVQAMGGFVSVGESHITIGEAIFYATHPESRPARAQQVALPTRRLRDGIVQQVETYISSIFDEDDLGHYPGIKEDFETFKTIPVSD